jgi:hypothetical protein
MSETASFGGGGGAGAAFGAGFAGSGREAVMGLNAERTDESPEPLGPEPSLAPLRVVFLALASGLFSPGDEEGRVGGIQFCIGSSLGEETRGLIEMKFKTGVSALRPRTKRF